MPDDATADATAPYSGRAMTAAEYAALQGVTADAIRARCRRGRLAHTIDESGQYTVYPDHRDAVDAVRSRQRRVAASDRRAAAETVAAGYAMAEHVADLRSERDRLAEQLSDALSRLDASESERRQLADRLDAFYSAMTGTAPAALPDASHEPQRPARTGWRARLFGG